MSIKSKEELLNGAKAIFGDSETDEVLEFLGDITDTLEDYENKVNDNEDWKKKYEEKLEGLKNQYETVKKELEKKTKGYRPEIEKLEEELEKINQELGME